ncbi:MAG: hypothetical protein AAF603_11185 [Pseudomonadota bacterium]
MTQTEHKTRALFESLGATELRRRLTAEKIFRELRKGKRTQDAPSIPNHFPKISPSLR